MVDDGRNKWLNCGNFCRADGWSEEIIAQVALEFDFVVETRPPTMGLNLDVWFSVWRKECGEMGSFWDRARELAAKVTK
jgi:hypothetical protein